ncbi:MAG TPA: NAD-dependent epimerase/dehydratase family protein [Clostridia bacterium]
MILITGATGHTGSLLLDELAKEQVELGLRCLVRKDSKNIEHIKKYKIELFYGDVANESDLCEAMKGADTVVHIVNIKYSPIVVAAAGKMGVSRLILIHTTGMFSKYRSYSSEYRRIEDEIINNCKVDYVILRPSMIYGSNLDHNMHKLINYIKTHRFMPVFGSGEALMQPVHARDLAKSIVLVIKNRNIRNKAYNITGANVLSYRAILRIIAKRVNPSIRFIYIPYWFSVLLGFTYNLAMRIIGRKAQLSVEQIRRLKEDKNYSHEDAKIDFGYAPITFETGIEEEIKSMGY